MRRTAWLSSLVVTIALCLVAGVCHADDRLGAEIAAKAGFGTNPSSYSVDPLGFALGARGGVTFFGVYGGLNVLRWFGGSDAGYATRGIQYGLEGGYGVTLLDRVTLRPQVGFGDVTFTHDVPGAASASDDHAYLEPGGTVLVLLGHLFVGADANALVVFGIPTEVAHVQRSETYLAFTVHGQVGARF